MSTSVRNWLAGAIAGLIGAGSLAYWLARFEPLSRQDYQALGVPVAGEAELCGRLDEERLRRHTEGLSAFSMRLGGSPAEAQARRWVVEQFQAVGLSGVHLSPVVYPRWRCRQQPTLTCFTPAPYEPDFIVLNGSAATPALGVESPLADAGAGSAMDYLRLAGPGLAGAVHLICPAPEGGEPRRDLVLRASAQGACAVILAHGTPSPEDKPLIENGTAVTLTCAIPALAVSHETGTYLRQKLTEGPVRALLHVDAGYEPGVTANVVGQIPGQRAEYVLLAAHYDAWYAGAADNAAGLACLLELARVWTEAGLRPYRTMRFVSYAAEEEGLMGSLFEVLTRAPLIKARCRGVVTPDVVGVPGGSLRFGGYPGLLVEIAARLAQQLGYGQATGYAVATRGAPVYADHWPYARLLLPALLVSKGPDPLYHTPYETAERLDYNDLRWTAAVVGAMALRLAQRK